MDVAAIQAKAQRAAERARARGHEAPNPDRSDPAALRRPAPAPAQQRTPATKPAPALRPVALEDRHHEPVESFACPRCGADTSQPFYGPCGTCCQALRGGSTVMPSPPGPPTPATPSGGGGPVLRRTQRRYRQRPAICAAATPTVAELLHLLPAGVERVYVVGPRLDLTASRSWYLGELPDGWSHDPAGHYLGRNPVGKYLDPAGQPVQVHRAAAWFGEGSYTVAEAEGARAALTSLLDELGTGMLATPGATGRQLLLQVIPERDGGWPVLAPEHQQLIRAQAGQGRAEHFGGGEPAELHEYDGRWYYAGLCWGLGAGPAVHDDRPEWDEYARGLHRVTFTVPAGWSGPGLLGVLSDEGGARSWAWPTAGTWDTWAGGAQLQVAARAGWAFQVTERLLLADGKANPMGGWADRIVRAGDSATGLVRKGLRMMLIATIGTLYGQPFTTTKVIPASEVGSVPAGADVRRLGGNRLSVELEAGQAWPAMAHPEWVAGIWDRGRARLLSGPGATGALHLDGGRIVAFRNDALYVTQRQPAWELADTGRPGQLTYKGGRSDLMPAPADLPGLLTQRTAWKDQ